MAKKNNGSIQTSVGPKSYRVTASSTSNFLIWRNDTGADVTVTSATCNRQGGPSYINAFAIVPDSAGLGTVPGTKASIADLLPYTLMSSGVSAPETILTFESPNPDLQYFEGGDEVQTGVTVISKDTTANTMNVNGGTWNTTNQSQTWSNLITGSPNGSGCDGGNGSWECIFTGNETGTFYTSGLTPAYPDTATFDLTSLGQIDSIRIRAFAYKNGCIKINGVTINYLSNTQDSADVDFTIDTSGFASVLFEWTYSPQESGAYLYIQNFYVDGKLLIDATNDSQVWSSNVTGNPNPSQPAPNGFDGDLTTATWASNGGYDITFPQPITVTESIKLRGNSQQSNWKLLVDDAEIAINEFGQPAPSWSNNDFSAYDAEVTVNVTGSFKGIRSTNNYGGLCAVYVDGTMLVDAGVRTDDGKVTYQTNGGQGTVDTVNAGNNSIVIVPTGDRDNRWIADNKAGTTFRAGSATKPAISQKAYLKFNGSGVVESIRSAPVAAQAMASRNPTLIFPATFDTGNAPDVEMPNPTSLKTTISRTNELGSASKSSNTLFPTTNTRSDLVAGAAATYTTDGFSEFVCMTKSHEGRAAEQRAITYAENCQALKDAAEQKAQDYINDNP